MRGYGDFTRLISREVKRRLKLAYTVIKTNLSVETFFVFSNQWFYYSFENVASA